MGLGRMEERMGSAVEMARRVCLMVEVVGRAQWEVERTEWILEVVKMVQWAARMVVQRVLVLLCLGSPGLRSSKWLMVEAVG